MSATFCCIADEDTVRGFRLAGVRGHVVNTAAEASAALDLALREKDCSILILTDEVAAKLGARLDAVRFERSRPLIAEIPGPSGSTLGGRDLQKLVHEAVGVRFPTQEE